jgi:lambda family phage tail tape measure protein
MAMNMDAMLRIKADVQGENNIRRLGNSMQGLQGQAKNAALGFNTLKGAVAGFGAAIAGSAIVGGLTAVVKKSIDAGDELFNLQAKTGIAANALIGIGNAAKLADVDIATVGKGLTKLNVNLVKAAEGNDGLAQKFKALGVNVKDANGQVVPADEALKQIADRFADLPDGAQKAAAAVAIFGKSGADLIPLLNEGSASIEEFTYKVGEDFAARSDLFNDTITTLGIKAQGFGLELTDALLPALQSILEVFSDLFNTDQNWTALFKIIEVGIRGVAVVIYTVVKAVDILIKNIVAAVQAAQAAFSGDFAGAWNVITNRVTSGIEEQKKILADLGKLAFGSASSPGTGRRTGGRSMALDTSEADRGAEAAARRAAAEEKRAAAEQERLLERRQGLTRKAIDLQGQLQNSIADVAAAYAGVGASATDQLFLQRNEAITENDRKVKQLTLSVVELAREINEAGGQLDVKPFADLIDRFSAASVALADQTYLQGLKDLLPSLDEYTTKIADVTRGKRDLTELEKLNAEIMRQGLDVIAQSMPAYAQYIEQLRQQATELDNVIEKQNSFSAIFKDSFKQTYDSATNLGANLAGAATSGIEGLTDAIVNFATTGKASFKEFAASVLQDLSRLILKFALFKIISGVFGGFGGGADAGLGSVASNLNQYAPLTDFAMGGIMTGDGPMPLKTYARGGIANSPQLAMFGEGSTPEAYVPLPDGRRIPVAMQGGGGGNTTVNVSVDAKGSQVQGNAGQGEKLGRAISQAVQAELIKQRRPGGLLAA